MSKDVLLLSLGWGFVAGAALMWLAEFRRGSIKGRSWWK